MHAELALPLSYASADNAHDADCPVPAPEDGGWFDDDGPLDDEPTTSTVGIPLDNLDGDADELAPDAWNLEPERLGALGRVAAAAAFVPMLLSATPAHAAPPLDRHLAAPAQAPAESPSSVWSTLVDRQVTLNLVDGTTFQGTVLGVAGGKLVCARAVDGGVVYVDPDEVRSARVEGLPGSKEPQTGTGAIVFGSIATTIGSGLALATVGMLATCGISYDNLCPYYTIPLGVTSLVNLSVGIPLLAHGVRKRKSHRAALAEPTDAMAPQFSAFVQPGRSGVMLGIGGRF